MTGPVRFAEQTKSYLKKQNRRVYWGAMEVESVIVKCRNCGARNREIKKPFRARP